VRVALDRAAAGIEGRFTGQPLVEASIRHTIGEAYAELGLNADAQRQLEAALKLEVAASGERHRAAIVDMNDLAEVYMEEGRYADGEALFTKALSIGRRALGRKESGSTDQHERSSCGVLSSRQSSTGRSADGERFGLSTPSAGRREFRNAAHSEQLVSNL